MYSENIVPMFLCVFYETGEASGLVITPFLHDYTFYTLSQRYSNNISIW